MILRRPQTTSSANGLCTLAVIYGSKQGKEEEDELNVVGVVIQSMRYSLGSVGVKVKVAMDGGPRPGGGGGSGMGE